MRLEVDKALLNVRVGRGEVKGDVQREGGRVVDVRRSLGEDYGIEPRISFCQYNGL